MGRCHNFMKQQEVCKRKVRYDNPMDADRAAKNHANRRGKPRHYSYDCPVCFGWHLATKTRFKDD